MRPPFLSPIGHYVSDLFSWLFSGLAMCRVVSCMWFCTVRRLDKMSKTDKICYCVNITRHIDMFSIPFALKISGNPLAHYLLYYYCVNTTQC